MIEDWEVPRANKKQNKKAAKRGIEE